MRGEKILRINAYDNQENKTCLIEMKTIWNYRKEFYKEIKALMRTQPEINIELKILITQQKMQKKNIASRMNQAGDRISELEDRARRTNNQGI